MPATTETPRARQYVDSHPHPSRAEESELNAITEPDLSINFENATVKTIVVEEVDSAYEVHVTLTWRRDGPLKLVTQRTNTPKRWVSLDRLVKNLRQFPNVPPLIVRLQSQEPSHDGGDATAQGEQA